MHYPGGKGKSYQHVLNLIPPHDVYIEPFLGIGSVMRHKRRSAIEFGVDLDERALRLSELCGQGVTLVCTDGIRFLKDYDFQGHEVVYCDPPYLPRTRRREKIYRFDTDDGHHQQLLDTIRSINARVLISGYESVLYNEALRDWNVHRYQAKTHTDVRQECVWYNFKRPAVLHDYRYLGRNYRERQTIKRRLNRLTQRISQLSDQEQEFLREWLTARGRARAT
tara:strand:+ start:12567 stop:13235 length:669 start_codon:yes stop_codon:yes gene_type:complete